MIDGIWLLLLGILAVPSLVIAKRPEAKDLIAKVAPYQGWFGAISAVFGAWVLLGAVLHLGTLLHFPLYGFTTIAVGVVLLGLGIILGVGVMKTLVKSETAHADLDKTLAKIAPYQGNLGIAGIVLGLWMIVASILWHL